MRSLADIAALNGNEVPDKLPEELIPPSMRDIDTTVNFMRDLLKHESTNRSNTSSPAYGGTPTPAANSKDATAYKHNDSGTGGTTYKPSSRHLDRKSVRYAGEDPNAEIGDIRRQLQNTSAMLDKSNSEYEKRSEEDERLEQEVDDLKYRVKRLQEDIDYVSKGRRTAEKDGERRKLERELLFLMHEKLPELERRQEQREEERRQDERAGIRARDKRNDTHGRYEGREDDHSWLKGSYDRERRGSRDRDYGRRDDRDRERDRRDSRDERDYRDSRDRSRERDYRPRSPPAARSPPPAPTTAPALSAPPAPPKPTKTDVPNTKNMTPEERTAFIREQAQRRIQERLKALGVESASETPAVDRSVEERLAQEKKEAEEKSKSAEEEQRAREQARQARLAGGNAAPTEEPKSPEPKSILKGAKAAPPPPASRGKQPPAPPTSRGAKAPVAPPIPAAATSAPNTVSVPVKEEEDDEDAEFKRREEVIKKAKEDRRRRLADLEREEEEERQREEQAASARKTKSPLPPTAPPPPAAPPAPPAQGLAAPASGGGYNPFRKPSATGAPPTSTGSTPAAGGFNPFFKPQNAASVTPSPVTSPPTSEVPPAAPFAPPPPAPPAPPPAPPAPAQAPRSASAAPAEDEWESIQEKEADSDDSSDDDDYATSRNHRRNLASALFGGLGGGSGGSPTISRPGSAAPKAPPAALKNLGGGNPEAGRGALLSAIQGGARLKKAQTVVKGASAGGKVIGDSAPPAHISETPREHPEVAQREEESGGGRANANRQSVDWYAGLAADQSHPAGGYEPSPGMESTKEEVEPDIGGLSLGDGSATGGYAPIGGEGKVDEQDELADFDLNTSKYFIRVDIPS